MIETIIDVGGVWFSFNGQPILQDVDLKVPRGISWSSSGPMAAARRPCSS